MKFKNQKVLIFIVFVFLSLVALVYFVARLRENLAPPDTGAAATSHLTLSRISPPSNTNLAVGSSLVVDVKADVTSGANVSEIALEFDPTALTLQSINDQEGMIYINKTINNTTGKATVDIGNAGPGDLAAGKSLVQFTFQVKSVAGTSSVIKLVTGTTLGFPNILAADGLGSLTVLYNYSATRKYLVTQTVPTAGTKVAPGGALTVSLSIDNPVGAGAGEVVLSYDKTKLTATAISEKANVLSLNENLGTTTGTLTFDIAKSGSGDFTANTVLVDINFTVNAAAVTGTAVVSVNGTSTLGIPDVLNKTALSSVTINILRTFCGDGTKQTPNSDGKTEVCDDGNTANNDQCASDCLHSCTSPQTWNGTACVGTSSSTTSSVSSSKSSSASTTATATSSKASSAVSSSKSSSATTTSTTTSHASSAASSANAGSCGDGTKQTPNSSNINEVCDDGNRTDADQCSNDCLHKCTAPQVWNGTVCRDPLPLACHADIQGDGTLDVFDFYTFGQHYLQTGLQCNLDLVGGDCFLNLADFIEFGQWYKIPNACKF